MSETTDTPAHRQAPPGQPGGHPSPPPQAAPAAPPEGGKTPERAGPGRKPQRKPAGPRPDRGITRAVRTGFAVAKAGPDVLDALAALTGAHGDPEDLAVAAASGHDASGLLVDVMNLREASPADGRRTAIRVRSADRATQLGLWNALKRLGAANGDPSRNPEELAFAITDAGAGVPGDKHRALRGALAILAAGRDD